MEDMYIKPGNQERGWNDPPEFSYGLQMARGPQRNPLSKRAVPAADPGSSPPHPPPYSPLGPPPTGAARPPLNPVCPPPTAASRPPEVVPEPGVDGVVSVLNCALAACRQVVKEQVCNDVAKRLRLLEDSWKGGKLSLPVRRRMDALSQELRSGHWDAADKIHLSLMVDHVTEVSQWMVGVKRLIAETRKLSPDLLEELKKSEAEASADPVQDSADPVQDSADPVQDSADPVRDSADPVQDSADPVRDTADTVRDSKDPVQDSKDPVQDTDSHS